MANVAPITVLERLAVLQQAGVADSAIRDYESRYELALCDAARSALASADHPRAVQCACAALLLSGPIDRRIEKSDLVYAVLAAAGWSADNLDAVTVLAHPVFAAARNELGRAHNARRVENLQAALGRLDAEPLASKQFEAIKRTADDLARAGAPLSPAMNFRLSSEQAAQTLFRDVIERLHALSTSQDDTSLATVQDQIWPIALQAIQFASPESPDYAAEVTNHVREVVTMLSKGKSARGIEDINHAGHADETRAVANLNNALQLRDRLDGQVTAICSTFACVGAAELVAQATELSEAWIRTYGKRVFHSIDSQNNAQGALVDAARNSLDRSAGVPASVLADLDKLVSDAQLRIRPRPAPEPSPPPPPPPRSFWSKWFRR